MGTLHTGITASYYSICRQQAHLVTAIVVAPS